jgi:hypothetical protein
MLDERRNGSGGGGGGGEGIQPYTRVRLKRDNIPIAGGTAHCNENLVYVFPEKELRGLSSNFHIHVSVSDLYITMVGPHFFLLQNRQTGRGNIYIAHRHINVEIRSPEAAQFLFWEYFL